MCKRVRHYVFIILREVYINCYIISNNLLFHMFFFYLIMNGIWVSGTWVALGPERKFFDLMITIKHVVYPFFLRWGPNANAVLSGIWALILRKIHKIRLYRPIYIAHEPCVIQQLALRDTIIINAIFYRDIVIGNFHNINLR